MRKINGTAEAGRASGSVHHEDVMMMAVVFTDWPLTWPFLAAK
jgi:hypothetical protein